MTAKNDITGDPLISKTPSEAYRSGWDRIFGKKSPTGEKILPKYKKPQHEPERDSSTLTEEQRQAIRDLTDHITKEQK